jgi:hypothetical protein
MGDLSLSTAKREEERGRRRSWGRGNWRPPVGGPEVAAPLDGHIAAGLQARPPDGERPCMDRGAGAVQVADA